MMTLLGRKCKIIADWNVLIEYKINRGLRRDSKLSATLFDIVGSKKKVA